MTRVTAFNRFLAQIRRKSRIARLSLIVERRATGRKEGSTRGISDVRFFAVDRWRQQNLRPDGGSDRPHRGRPCSGRRRRRPHLHGERLEDRGRGNVGPLVSLFVAALFALAPLLACFVQTISLDRQSKKLDGVIIAKIKTTRYFQTAKATLASI